jgi:hypothetical protein
LEWAEDKKKLFRLLGNIGIQKRPNKKIQKCISTKNNQEFVQEWLPGVRYGPCL